MADIPAPKDIVNTLYHSAVLSGLTVGYSMVAKKFMKFDVGDPSKDYESILKLVVPVTLSVVTRDWLVAKGFIPNNILNAARM
jgi:hypothetical protein